MTTEARLLQAILADPRADDTWLVLADWFEEQGQTARAELTRLQLQLRRESRLRVRATHEQRVRRLLADGVEPSVPTLRVSLGLELALVPAGIFWMGSIRQPAWENSNEHPRRKVEITQPFFLGIHPVTQGQYEYVLGSNPSHFGPHGPGASLVHHLDHQQLPVENVSYNDALEFCRRFSALPEEAQAGRVYRLPTEAEWEYACRAGICQSAYHWGSRLTRRHARFGGQGGGHPLPVRSFRPNLFGLYQMHGNVWEWCADWYAEGYYEIAPPRDPFGPPRGTRRVLRGGGWSTPVTLCRSALRGHNHVDARHNYNGFRLALSVPIE